ncbi:MAG: hypothetical protein WAX04_08645 [Oscillospiraceae bacterium]
MSKYRKWIVAFCLLSSASMMFGLAAKTTFTYAPLAGWFLSGTFIIIAIIMWFKAIQEGYSTK